MEEKKRFRELDIAKGIGIIMVVWAHASGPFSNYMYQFHMPLFFFISGMLYVFKGQSIKDYAIRKTKSLLLPFWWWNGIFFPIYLVLKFKEGFTVSQATIRFLEIFSTLDKVPFLGATWFLPSLFWVSIITHLLFISFSKNKYRDFIILGLSVVFGILAYNYTLPYKLSRTLICWQFYIAGYIYQNYLSSLIKDNLKFAFTLLCAIAFYFIAPHNIVNMGENVYLHYSLFILGAVLASLAVLGIAKLLVRFLGDSVAIKHLEMIGRNSLDLLIWQFLAFRAAILLQIVICKAPLNSLFAFPSYDVSGYWWIIYTLAGIYGSLIWKWILSHNRASEKMKALYMIRD